MAYNEMTPWNYADYLSADHLNLMQNNIQDNHDNIQQNAANIANNTTDIANNATEIQNIKNTQYLTAAYWE